MTEVRAELSSLLSSATLVFLGSVVSAVASLGERVVLGRALTTGTYGDITIALAVLSLGTTVSCFGLPQGVSRYMSRFDDPSDKRGVWATGLLVAGSLGLVVATTLFLAIEPVADLLLADARSSAVLLPFVLAIPLQVATKVGIGGIRGMENTIYKTYVGDLLLPLGRIALLVVLLSLGVGATAAGYAYLATGFFAASVAHVLLGRLLPLVGAVRVHVREMTAFSAPLVVSTLLNVLLTRTDTLMLGYLDSSFATGMYGYAYPLATGLLLVVASFGFLYLPLASRLDARDDHRELNSVYAVTTKWAFVATFPLFLVFVTFPGDVLAIVFAEQARAASLALVLLSGGFFTNAMFGRNRETLSALGRTKIIMVANGAAYVANVVLNLLLIPALGFEGAAVASAAAYISMNLLIYVVLRRWYDISPFAGRSRRTYLLVPALLVPVAAGVSGVVEMTLATLPVVLAGAGIATVVVVAATGCLQREDELVLSVCEDALGTDLSRLRRLLALQAD